MKQISGKELFLMNCQKRPDYNEYEILDEFEHSHKPIRVKHISCGHIYEIAPGHFLDNSKNGKYRKCPHCYPKNWDKKKPLDKYLNLGKQLPHVQSGEYIINEYDGKSTGTTRRWIVTHTVCGLTYSVDKYSFVSGCKCCKCYGKRLMTIPQLKEQLFDLVGDEYTLLSDTYEGNDKYIKILHNKCGNIVDTTYNSFQRGDSRCPYCSASTGEQCIMTFLERNYVPYTYQMRFEDCLDKRTLPFDFYLPTLNVAIEYDGEQHFYPTRFKNGKEQFKATVYHDNIKTKYCHDHNIKLLRIPYTEKENINKILMEAIL